MSTKLRRQNASTSLFGDQPKDPLGANQPVDPLVDPLSVEPNTPTTNDTLNIALLPAAAWMAPGVAAGINVTDLEGNSGTGALGLSGHTTTVAGGLGGLVGMASGASDLVGGNQRVKDSKKSGDHAGEALGKSSMASGGVSLAGGAATTTKAALNTGAMFASGSSDLVDLVTGSADAAGAGLATAGAVTGVVGGGINAIKAGYEGGKAARNLHRAKQGTALTPTGQAWLDRIRERQSYKIAIQSLKFAGAVVGIVGGALLLASNPVGWAIGIAAAAVGIGMLVAGLVHKANKSLDRKKAKTGKGMGGRIKSWFKKKLKSAKSAMSSSPKPMPEVGESEGAEVVDPAPDVGIDPEFKVNESALADKDPVKLKADAKTVKLKAEEAERIISKNYTMGGDIRSALLHDPELGTPANVGSVPEHKLGHDGEIAVHAVGVSADEATSASGAELIAKKVSAIDGM